MPQALSDDQVQGELKKMVSFIKQEALEKAKEIHIKADEEFQLEKAKLVRQECAKIDQAYEGRMKKAAMSQQIARSAALNKTRLRVLAARQEALDVIFEETRKKLGTVSKDKAKYQELMKNLILQGLYTIIEPKIEIRVREEDNDIASKCIGDACSEYEKALGNKVEIQINKDDPIPKSGAGGVIVTGLRGRIQADNTLEERLRLLEQQALPTLRASLFGKNPNRKFED